MTTHSPAKIMAEYLILISLGSRVPTAPDPLSAWPVYSCTFPETPNELISVYDTVGTIDGRIRGGETIEHPGIQIRVRSETEAAARAKMKAIAAALDDLYRLSVTLEGTNYRIQSATRTSILPLGQDATKRRFGFTINALLTVKEI